jgi:quercetin dioxygenase-like cupin family protein
MRRGSVAALLIVLVLAIGASQGMYRSTQAQDATPPADQQGGAPEGVSFVSLASGTIEVLSPGTANLTLGRIRLAPGATLPFDPTDPSVDLVYMSSGTLTFRVEADMTVARGVSAGTPVPTEPEAIAANTEFTMSDGDSALFPPNAAGEVRNDGDEDATAWVTNVALFTSAASTPTP